MKLADAEPQRQEQEAQAFFKVVLENAKPVAVAKLEDRLPHDIQDLLASPPHGAPEHIECVTPPPDCFLGHGTARHDAREIRKADEISVAFIFCKRADLAPCKMLTRLLELRRHCDLCLLEECSPGPRICGRD